MAKLHTHFVCQECGRTSVRQLGRCPSCGGWNTMVEEIVEPAMAKQTSGLSTAQSKPRKIYEVLGESEDRWDLDMVEFARVLGGGVVPGSIVLLGGDPGIGKSTLMLQVAAEIAQKSPVLYASGEESAGQIKMRAQRITGIKNKIINAKNLFLVTETNLDAIFTHVEQVKPVLLVIDSIQTVYLDGLTSSAGSVSQVRECASRLREFAKTHNIAVFLIGHVTKQGIIAGPRVLEHIVDTVLQLEGDRFQSYRLLRSMKNRFGPTSEVGVFEMCEQGMVEVLNPSEAFLAERMAQSPGSSIAVTMEGTRPILVELQGLTSPTNFGNPRRTTNGMDYNRVLLITAVLTRRLGMHLSDQDVFLNVVGGLRVEEPAADLAAATALVSSLKDRPVKADMVLIGEVGLSGELRWVSRMEQRLNEAAKLGFKSAVIPKRIRVNITGPNNFEILEARSLARAVKIALND
ncbi:MAG: DNA repair protein RadA [Anaerolineaceae bacterium]|nr:DNA repair protein RadA [Anaerolineaceae bacterium]